MMTMITQTLSFYIYIFKAFSCLVHILLCNQVQPQLCVALEAKLSSLVS